MKTVRIGIIGLGNIGQHHARTILAGKVPHLRLAAVADADASRRALFPGIDAFDTHEKLIHSGAVDAVIIATPHYHHTAAGIAALDAGLHVLVEKPISVQRSDCDRLLAAHRGKTQVFAAMFNQRTDPLYRKLRQLISSGALGEIQRISWTITDWFRSDAYYASSGWRATWSGEGGGVLLNQCPHNLDMFQWLFGMPERVHGFCRFGRYHDIEVEDDVTAYFEMRNGTTATFIAATGESPGTNRLEVAADGGRVVIESRELRLWRNKVPASKFSRTTKEFFNGPPSTETVFRPKSPGGQHTEILRNFTAAILRGEPLIAPAAEGVDSVELANAILLSSWTAKPVDLPLNPTTYARWLKKKIAASSKK